MRMLFAAVMIALVSHLLQTLLTVIYYMVFPLVAIMVLSVMHTKGSAATKSKLFCLNSL